MGIDRPSTDGEAGTDLATDEVRGPLTFEAFYAGSHGEIVRGLALALGDDDLGRDAAAEGFTRALQRWRTVSKYDNPAGWVYRVGLNWARSRHRKLAREVHVEVETALADTIPTDPALMRAMRGLSLDHRAAIVGRYYLDWSEAALAESLGISAGTVKSRLSRALDRLAKDLEGHDE